MAYSLALQSYDYEEEPSLHETIVESYLTAKKGWGVFAFATKSGASLILEDPNFLDFISDHPFELLVGLDEITDSRTIQYLSDFADAHMNLKVRAFYHTKSSVIFHPKFCCFEYDDGGRIIVGSGNLTLRGLRNNWEAYSIYKCPVVESEQIRSQWMRWQNHHENQILELSDTRVIERASQNRFVRSAGSNASAGGSNEPTAENDGIGEPEVDHPSQDPELDDWGFGDDASILIREVPRSGSRWKQVNFDKASFEGYFGAIAGDNTLRIVFRQIADEMQLGELEIRQSVSVISQNYRFELQAAAGLDYPNNGRPIVIFVKIAPRLFLYCLLMPSDASYSDITAFLTANYSGAATRMKTVTTTATSLQASALNLPLWQLKQIAATT